MIRRSLLLLMLLLPLPALASPLVGDLSNYRVNIDSGFNGTRIFLFGARNDAGDVVAVIRGPEKNYIVRKKERVAGIWVNQDRMKFFNVPDFYAIMTSRPLDKIEQGNLFQRLGIGYDHIMAMPTTSNEFVQAFMRHQQERRLYSTDLQRISFMGETLFKSAVDFPDDIPPGDYTAELYLLSDGELSGMQSIPITVVKSGLDAALYTYAHSHPALYGVTAVLLTFTIGWFAGRVMEKR